MGHTVHAVGSGPAPWIGLASACWAANAALGASVGAGIVRTGRFRWIHHALYIATTTTTAARSASGAPRTRISGRGLSSLATPAAEMGSHAWT